MVLSSYLDNRKKTTRDFYHAMYSQHKRRAMEVEEEAANTVQMETMKAFVANLPEVVLDDDDDDNNDDVLLYEGSDD